MVALKDVDVGVFRRIIGWMYTSEIEISDAGDAIALFELASVLRIGDLELCVRNTSKRPTSNGTALAIGNFAIGCGPTGCSRVCPFSSHVSSDCCATRGTVVVN